MLTIQFDVSKLILILNLKDITLNALLFLLYEVPNILAQIEDSPAEGTILSQYEQQ